jgi:hypothetical protein
MAPLTERQRELLRSVASGDTDAEYDLLQEMFRGLPVTYLRPLLASPDDRVVSAGVWIASELAPGSRPLLPDVAPLLGHASSYVRFYALDMILDSADTSDGMIVAAAVARCDDPDRGVRWKALDLLTHLDDDVLRAAIPHVAAEIAESLEWLTSDLAKNVRDVVEGLGSVAAIRRAFSGAAAARLGGESLDIAARSTDEAVAQYASSRQRVEAAREKRV